MFILSYGNTVVRFEYNARATCFNRTVRFMGLHRLEKKKKKRSLRSKEKFFSDAVSTIDTSRHVLPRVATEMKGARYHRCEDDKTFRSRRRLQFRLQCSDGSVVLRCFTVRGYVIFHSVRFHFPDGDVDVLSSCDCQTMLRFVARLIFVSFLFSRSSSCFFCNLCLLRQ